MNNTNLDLLKSVKSKSRQEEINKYGKLISFRKSVIRNKKKYNRNVKHKSQTSDSYFIFLTSIKIFNDFKLMNQVIFDVDIKHLPTKSTSKAACYDLKANISGCVEIHPGERKLIPTGLRIGLRDDTHAEVRSRSGLALKYGICVLNSPGTIDEDYDKEVGVILYNSDKSNTFTVYDCDRIAQLYIADKNYIIVDPKGNELNCIVSTERTSGFGSTGIK